MKVRSLKHNFIMYFIRIFSGFGFTICIFPYVARILGAEAIGKIQYVETIVGYFLLFINFGIASFGKREVALQRDDKNNLSNLISELLTILLVTTCIGSIGYFMFIQLFIHDFVNKRLFYIYFVNIILNIFGVEWFYLGIENQTYITKRNICIKIISACFIFLFVKNKNNLFVYVWIMLLATVGSNIYNFMNLKNYVILGVKSFVQVAKHLKRLLYIFFSSIATTIYYSIDSIMIGNMIGDTELGYYTLVLKFGKIPLAIGTIVTGILSPRLTNLLGQNKVDKYRKLWEVGRDLIYLFYIPVAVGMFLLAQPIILILGGKSFMPAIVMFKIFSLYIITMGIAVLTGISLDNFRKDKEYSLSVILGAILNVVINVFLIRKIGAVGAIIATIATELLAVIVRIALCGDIFKKIKLVDFNVLKLIIASILMGVAVFHVEKLINNIFLKVGISTIIGALVYTVILLLLKERLTWMVIEKLKSKVQLLVTSK